MTHGFADFDGTTENLSDSGNLNEQVGGIENLLAEEDPGESQDGIQTAEGGEAPIDQISGESGESGTVPPDGSAGEPGREEPPVDLYKVVVDGEELEVPLDELQAGYRKHADYTRKTQELANQRNEFEAEKQQTAQVREQYKHLVTALTDKLKESAGDEPDWTKLAAEDPAGYVQTKAAWDQRQNQIKAAEQEQRRLEQEDMEQHQAQYNQYMAGQRNALLTAKPELKEAEKATEFFAGINTYAKNTFGFTDAELSGVTDHRLMLIVEKAMMFDQMQAKGQQIQTEAKARTVPLKPGRAKTSNQVAGQTHRRQRERLEKTGSIDDAASMIEGLL